jgi:uncharacterized protein (UPF0333 family)
MRKPSLSRRATVLGSIVLAGVLAAGGATAYAAGTGSTSSKSAGSSASPSGATAKKKTKKAKARTRAEHRLAARSVHGQLTVRKGRTGAFVTREWQRGEITAVSGTTLTVKSTDGTSWTWKADPKVKITRDGKKTTASALKSGDTVAITGRKSGTANDAVRIHAPSAAQLAKAKAKAKGTQKSS